MYSWGDFVGAGVYSIVVNIVLLLVVLVSPTLSGNAINGDRDAATLAAVQVTAASTGDIMLGKLLAAIATGGAFLLVAVPFLALSLLGGGADALVLLVSLLVLAVEIIVVAAIGVGLSGLIARPLFSVAATYLVVAGTTYEVPRFDYVWWALSANPFVVLADATPTEFSPEGYPVDLFGQIKLGVRSAQQSPLEQRWDEC
ncbi:MAG: transporter, partial [Microbacterium sp.]|nr:transporter [Microbacterium sp.]